jgi:hypothetical protein
MVHLTIQTRISRGERGAQAAFVTRKNGADSKLRCSLIQMCVRVCLCIVLWLQTRRILTTIDMRTWMFQGSEGWGKRGRL